MVVVLVDEITSRVDYTFDFIFGKHGLEYGLVVDPEGFEVADGTKLNYSKHASVDVVSIMPSNLLYSEGVWQGNPEEFKSDTIGYLSFEGIEDPIASVFYVLSRMEEYDSAQYDEHGRFPFSESILKRFGWIDKAICDRWSEHLIKDLLKLEIPLQKGRFIPTFDIDNTYAYKLKSGKRRLLSKLRDVTKFDLKRLKERKTVEKGGKDPYDTFDKIKDVSENHRSTQIFWLTESEGSKDRNISIENAEHRKLIKKMSGFASVNIHPSYGSFRNPDQIERERTRLESITGIEISSSRQHFLRFQLPHSYQDLIQAGIKNDYSMGFAENVGFRTGTAHAHKWFDLNLNKTTELTVHPFVYMDGTLNEYMQLSIDESKLKIEELYNEVQAYGGDFIFLWHNETIGDYGKWKGWSHVLDFTLNLNNE